MAKIKNLAPRVQGFGRIVSLKPGETQELSDEQIEQLRRDRTIRPCIVDRVVAVQPADLFDLTEDPDMLDPVAQPPRRKGTFMDNKAQAQRAMQAKTKATAVAAHVNAWSDDEDFDNDGEPTRKRKPAVDETKVKPINKPSATPRPKAPPLPEVKVEANFVSLPQADQLAAVNACEDLQTLINWFQSTTDTLILKAIEERGSVVQAALSAPKA